MKEFVTAEDEAVYKNPSHPFMVKLKTQLKKASDFKKGEYGLFFASAGHASIYDYPKARGLHSIAEDIWSRGDIVSAVCHGPAILPGIIDAKTGKSIIAHKAVTGFTTRMSRPYNKSLNRTLGSLAALRAQVRGGAG